MTTESSVKLSNKRTIVWLLGLTVAMFGFGYALVPLYDLFCEITGIGGKPTIASSQASPNNLEIDESRSFTIEFTGNSTNGMPLQFYSTVPKTRVKPGEIHEVAYYVKNTSSRDITGQAVPSVTPMALAQHLVKLECFCFEQQLLPAGEEREMMVRFYVDPKASDKYSTITLSYSFFEMKNQMESMAHTQTQH